ncbi:MAG: hypothetical protein LAT62_13410 [Natronospirillum sp.]|uniref:hypothetical protein n=1 Tax=Natronospirillum sp. TaxID=2812955 RepID=UPI0025E628A1|nr:hypothetical protein [Natronospirillum sp.]MCH8552931.1 hypothetical protein [Natronospirillum sp.]
MALLSPNKYSPDRKGIAMTTPLNLQKLQRFRDLIAMVPSYQLDETSPYFAGTPDLTAAGASADLHGVLQSQGTLTASIAGWGSLDPALRCAQVPSGANPHEHAHNWTEGFAGDTEGLSVREKWVVQALLDFLFDDRWGGIADNASDQWLALSRLDHLIFLWGDNDDHPNFMESPEQFAETALSWFSDEFRAGRMEPTASDVIALMYRFDRGASHD